MLHLFLFFCLKKRGLDNISLGSHQEEEEEEEKEERFLPENPAFMSNCFTFLRGGRARQWSPASPLSPDRRLESGQVAITCILPIANQESQAERKREERVTGDARNGCGSAALLPPPPPPPPSLQPLQPLPPPAGPFLAIAQVHAEEEHLYDEVTGVENENFDQASIGKGEHPLRVLCVFLSFSFALAPFSCGAVFLRRAFAPRREGPFLMRAIRAHARTHARTHARKKKTPQEKKRRKCTFEEKKESFAPLVFDASRSRRFSLPEYLANKSFFFFFFS